MDADKYIPPKNKIFVKKLRQKEASMECQRIVLFLRRNSCYVSKNEKVKIDIFPITKSSNEVVEIVVF